MAAQILVLLALVALVFPSTVNAHFTLQSPVPSREKIKYPNSNTRFFPIRAAGELRPEKDCLQLPRSQRVANMQPGSTVTLGFEIGAGARHVGPCTAQLINLSTGATQNIGSEADCVNKRDAMTVKLPSQTCDNCVIKVAVKATHLGPNNPEFYDSCMDVNIGGAGGGGGNGGGANPPPPQPAPPGRGRGNNGGGNGNPRPTPTDPRRGGVANGGRPAQPGRGGQNQPPQRGQTDGAGLGAGASCTANACGPTGSTIRWCVNGAVVEQPVAPGTKCTAPGNNIQLAALNG